MVQLFFDLFGKYGPIYKYPSRSPLTEFEWSLDCDLDPSFEFLVHPEEELVQILDSEDAFMAFLAGFFDADGSIFFHRKQSHGGFEFTLTNMDFSLLESIATRLGQVGLHPRMRKSPQKHERGVKNGAPWIWKMSLWRHEEVARMLRRLELRHHEKQSKKALALRLKYRSPDSERGSLLAEWDRLRASIKEEIAACIELAKNAHKAKFGVEMQK
jgi:LAGLIDADG-like domain